MAPQIYILITLYYHFFFFLISFLTSSSSKLPTLALCWTTVFSTSRKSSTLAVHNQVTFKTPSKQDKDSTSFQPSPRKPRTSRNPKFSEYTPIFQIPFYWNCVLQGNNNDLLTLHTLLLRYLIITFILKIERFCLFSTHSLKVTQMYEIPVLIFEL